MRPSFLLLLLGMLACDEDEKPIGDRAGDGDGPDGSAVEGLRWSEDAGRLPLEGALHSEALKVSTTGPWSLRVAGEGLAQMERGSSRAGAPMGPPPPSMSPMLDLAAPGGPRGGGGGVVDAVDAGPLRAGATDDNLAFAAFLTYLQESYPNPQMAEVGGIARLNVSGRRMVQARDAAGAPLPGARVSIVDAETDRLLWTGRTQGDGRIPFYPHLYEEDGAGAETWTVQVAHSGQVEVASWSSAAAEELAVTLDVSPAREEVRVDVCFIIDTTGSMSDEIARVKQTLLAVTGKLRSDAQEVDLRYGAVLYRDIGDQYLTQMHPFTSDIQAFDQALQGIEADGGGDGPESLNQGLAVAMGGMDWREDTAKVAFLIADAPPHMDYAEDVPYGRSALAAIHNGVRIHTVAASGLDDRGSLVFRQVAQLTRGKFIFIEYGSAAASAADHGVTGPVAANNLDAILYEQIRAEIQGWGRETTVASHRRTP